VAQNATMKGQDDEGGCEQTFGEDCVGNFTAMIASKRADAARRNGTGACGGITLSDFPDQCAGSLSVPFLSYSMLFASFVSHFSHILISPYSPFSLRLRSWYTMS
jgi:hypothetical protein